MKYRVTIKEQPPMETGIYCEIAVQTSGGVHLDFGNMYFVCSLDRKVIQYPKWFKHEQAILRQIHNLGYTYYRNKNVSS